MKIIKQLTEVQIKLKAPKNQYNQFGKYNYRSCEDILEAVKPLLQTNGLNLVLSDSIETVGGRVYVKATAIVRNEEGESIENCAFARESETKKGMDDSQITGTASSYARKYALNGMFLIDDTKDADTNQYHEQTQSDKQSGTQSLTCPECGNPITKGVKYKGQAFTPEQLYKTFGRCTECLKRDLEAKKAES
jgi:hypothetical protein